MLNKCLLGMSACFFVLACQTTESNSPSESQSYSLEKNDLSPSELWSPEQRQANAHYYYLLAEDSKLSGDHNKAVKLYEMAYNLDPNSHLASKFVAAKGYLQPEEAFRDVQRMSLLYPKDPKIILLLGQFQLARGRAASSAKQFTRVLDLDSGNIEAYLGLIQANQLLGKHKIAMTLVNEMLDKNPTYAGGWAMLAKMHLGNKEYKSSLKAAKRAYQLQSMNTEYMLLYAISLELNGDSESAVRIYESIFRSNPDNDQLIERMVGLYKQIGSLEEALSLLEEVSGRSKEINLPISLQIVFINWELKNYKRSAELLDELHGKYPSNLRVTYMTGLGAEKLEKYEKAEKIFSSINQSSEFYIHAQYRLVMLYRLQKNLNEAIQVSKKIIDENHERSIDFYLLLGNLYDEDNNLSKSVDILTEASEKYPERMDVLFLLGVKQEKYGKVDDCIETMKKLIKMDSSHAGAHNYLGYIYAERGEKLDEAEKLIKRALELRPNDGYYMDSLGWS